MQMLTFVGRDVCLYDICIFHTKKNLNRLKIPAQQFGAKKPRILSELQPMSGLKDDEAFIMTVENKKDKRKDQIIDLLVLYFKLIY